ncbi:MAG: O-antigen ligase family protein, partial [Gammaproteobacteria bacterium]|nr:O-antigen ligase family protein [Gammaproteobacteria bacterium]
LELFSETGLLGLGLWLAAIIFAWRAARRMPETARHRAHPASVALLVTLFPLNTHYAVYSAFWGLTLLWLVAVWLVLLGAENGAGADQS